MLPISTLYQLKTLYGVFIEPTGLSGFQTTLRRLKGFFMDSHVFWNKNCLKKSSLALTITGICFLWRLKEVFIEPEV